MTTDQIQAVRSLDEELTRTLRTFFTCDLNVNKAGRELYVHRNTVLYRFGKIEKQTGLDPLRFSDAVALYRILCASSISVLEFLSLLAPDMLVELVCPDISSDGAYQVKELLASSTYLHVPMDSRSVTVSSGPLSRIAAVDSACRSALSYGDPEVPYLSIQLSE